MTQSRSTTSPRKPARRVARVPDTPSPEAVAPLPAPRAEGARKSPSRTKSSPQTGTAADSGTSPTEHRTGGDSVRTYVLDTSVLISDPRAILRFAVTATLAGIDIQTVGTILMVIGVIGFALSLWFYLAARRRAPGPPPPPPSATYR